MKTYDEVVGFDYTNAEEWRSFVKNQILALHKSISKIVKLRENIEELISTNLSDLIRNNTNIKQILLGGVDENGDYKPNSLARIYREFLGVSINTKEWVSLCKQPGIDAADYIKCNFNDTPFLQFIKDVKEIIDGLLSLAEIDEKKIDESEEKAKEILKNPERIVDELKEIYKLLVSISANHSYYTFFTINTRCIPRYYIEQAYPKLKDKFEEVAEFLGLEPKFIPDVNEGEMKRGYTLWGHKENGFADLMRKLNEVIWENFEKEDFRKLFGMIASDVENLRQKYYDKVKKSLDRIGWKFPEYIQTTSDSERMHQYKIVGPVLTEHILSVYTIGGHPWDDYRTDYLTKRPRWLTRSRKCEIPLLKLINDLSPALFILPEPKKEWFGDYRYGTYHYSGGIKVEFERDMLKLIGGV